MNNLFLASWADLLNQFDIKTIFIVALLLFFAIKEIIQAVDYFKKRKKNEYKEMSGKDKRLEELEKGRQENRKNIENISCDIQTVKQSVELLIESDKNDIKAWITEKHHYFMRQRWIDDYSLDCIERRFKCYQREGGNSYVEELVNEIRKLQHFPPEKE